ncbi:MAG: M1 family aminopeptidase [Haliscomenobacter sp.]
MKVIRYLQGLAGILLFCSVPLVGQEVPVCKTQLSLSEMESTRAARQLTFRASPYSTNYDLKYHRLEWTINPAVYYIKGKVTSYFVPLEQGMSTLNMDLYTGLKVTGVTRNGVSLAYNQLAGDRLEILLGSSLAAGRLDSVSVAYEGAPRQSAFGSFTQTYHSGTPIISTLSEPYGALDWWPCKQSLEDKIDSLDIFVRTPAAYRAASNGVLVEEYAVGTEKVYHWKHRYPIPTYLIAVGVTNYAVYSHYVPVSGRNPIEILNYVYPEYKSTYEVQTQASVGIMQVFNQLFGIYPFADEKYGHAQFPFGGGMEHQTMSFMGGFSHLLQAHEMAHQWFGDKVTCGSWADIWLNEGFATYLEGLTYQYGLGSSSFQSWLSANMRTAAMSTSGSVFVDDTTSVSRIFSSVLSYSKGAMLLHMLRGKLGDNAFFQGVRNYLNDPTLAYGYARTADLQRHLEAAGGQDLAEFFRDWFYGRGYPSYTLYWRPDAQGARFRLEQTSSHSSVPFFEMPVRVQFIGNGRDTILTFEHQTNNQEFLALVPFEVREIVIDPDLWILTGTKKVVASTTGMIELATPSIQIWPNPVSDLLYFNLPAGVENASFRLYDFRGQLLRTGTAVSPLPVQDLQIGYYQLLFQNTAGKTWQARFVKQLRSYEP